MLPGMELMGCADLAVPAEVMHHVVGVESSWNPFAIGVVGGRLARQPRTLEEALSTSRMLEREGYNFSLGLAQVNRHNFARQGLQTHEQAFDVCPNLRAGARILADCHTRADGDWGKAFSCYYSGNFTTGFRHGYVQKVLASWQGAAPASAIPVIRRTSAESVTQRTSALPSRVTRRVQEAAAVEVPSNPLRQAPAPGAEAGRLAAAVDAAQSSADDAPVTVQLTGTRPARNPAAPAESSQTGPSPARDSAFVF